MSNLELVVVLLTGGGLGGLLGEVLRYRRERAKDRVDRLISRHSIGLEDFQTFEATWRAEMKRLHEEIGALRKTVAKLSAELKRLGVDPMIIHTERDDEGGLRSPPEEPRI